MQEKVSWHISYSLKYVLIDHKWLLRYTFHSDLISTCLQRSRPRSKLLLMPCLSIFHYGTVLCVWKPPPDLSGLPVENNPTPSFCCYVPRPAWHLVNLLVKCFFRMRSPSKWPQAMRKTFPKSCQALFRQPSRGLLRDPSSPTSRTVRLGNFCQSGGCKWHLIIVLICISQITNENKQLFLCFLAIFSLCSEPIRLLAFLLLIWEVLFFFWNIYFLINPLLDKCIVNLNPRRWFVFFVFFVCFGTEELFIECHKRSPVLVFLVLQGFCPWYPLEHIFP